MQKRVGSFIANHVDGTPETVVIFQDFIESTDLQGDKEWTPGLKSLRTSSGRHVNRVDPGHYEIVDLPLIPLTSDDPNAL